ncbi:hypothetical protein HHL11_09555 [Ramlibacter sp. G-1-2-2]|uniref:Uncharacterized protein n=1 Tax=Ramlibacter agri TaxID=2728837 RepID=A0A848H096_9BURK|nr:hypothetical protein [Ramlibacter agri]NML43994.1 hypothetical protein [Ramlibacter agri]
MKTPRPDFPTGRAFWQRMASLEDECARKSLRSGSKQVEAIVDGLGTVVSLLYRTACCYWGCHGREHVFEYLAGRTCTSALGSYRLIGFGYYDESLALSRNISEIGNLMQLFFSDAAHIRKWIDSSEKERRHDYSPAAVRKTIEALDGVVPTDKDHYAWLCEVGTHVNPSTLPGAHNDERRPILGSIFQTQGHETSVRALAWAVCTVAGPLAKLAILERQHANELLEQTLSLVELLPDEP